MNGKKPYKAPNPFQYTLSQLVSTNASFDVFSIKRNTIGTHQGWLTTQAQMRLYNKLKAKAYTSLQLGADFGERKQSIETVTKLLKAVRNPLQTLGKIMRDLTRRSKQGRGSPAIKDVSGAFLEFQYGVRPLIGSIYDACGVLQKPYPVYRVRASVPNICTLPGKTAPDRPNEKNWRYAKYTYEGRYSGGFNVIVENPVVHSMERCGVLNPASIAWELVPFSFVVDWFIPVGKFISSISDYAGCSLTNQYQTLFVEGTETLGYRNRSDMSGPLPDLTATAKTVTCVRRVGPLGFPVKGLRELQLSQSKEHCANALALILQMRNRGA